MIVNSYLTAEGTLFEFQGTTGHGFNSFDGRLFSQPLYTRMSSAQTGSAESLSRYY